MINPDTDGHKLHADREEVWSEVGQWYQRQMATEQMLASLVALYDLLQLEGAALRDAVGAASADELDVISRLATAAICEAAYRHHCTGDDDGIADASHRPEPSVF